MATKKRATGKKGRTFTPETSVGVNINGCFISVDNVDPKKAGPTLAAILDVIRGLQKRYPELRIVHPTLGGYAPIEVWDDWDEMSAEEKRKIGFQ